MAFTKLIVLNLISLFIFSPPLFSEEKPPQNVLDSSIVISLERHSFRYNETKKLMEQAGFTNIIKFNAIDGFNTEPAFFEKLHILGGAPGQKGCAASHLLIWKQFFSSPSSNEFLFVSEDDMLPHSNFATLFPQYWKQTPKDFDIVLVGNQFDHSNYKKEDLVVQVPSWCTHAYIISKKGAEKLYNLYMNLPPDSGITFVIDIFLVNAMYNNKIQYFCYNGKNHPDPVNFEKGNIRRERDTGICFQNNQLGCTIHSVELTKE